MCFRRGVIETVLLFRIFVFILLAFFSHSALAQPITAAGSQPALVSPVVVSSGWRIITFILNNLAAMGDPVPGSPDKVLVGFPSNNNPSGLLAINDRDCGIQPHHCVKGCTSNRGRGVTWLK